MLAGTIAEFFIEDKTERVEFEIGRSDLPAFRNILPDELYQRELIGAFPFCAIFSMRFNTAFIPLSRFCVGFDLRLAFFAAIDKE